ncbi:spore germination protein [Psychrobacillus sp. FSL H8-0483]|uniref:spore germination protein n=1 Tax=Psychrobacillus sp. FSL H8-0483 TaxID=2921389 RepID=UPI00315B1ED3
MDFFKKKNNIVLKSSNPSPNEEKESKEKVLLDNKLTEMNSTEMKSADKNSLDKKLSKMKLTEMKAPEMKSKDKELIEKQSTNKKSPETKAPEKKSADKESPETKAPEKKSTDKEPPETKVPEKKSTDKESPETKAPEKKSADSVPPETKVQEKQSTEQTPLKKDLSGNLQTIKDTLGESGDIIIREIRIGKEGSVKAAVIYTDGLSDSASLQNFILETLMIDIKGLELEKKIASEPNLLKTLKDFAMTVGEIKDLTTLEDLYTALLSGDAIILIDGYSKGFIVGNKHWMERGVTEPTAQSVVRGPREGFSENIRINTALVRRIIKDQSLWIESRTVGKLSKTNVAIMYLNGVADDNVVSELRQRLDLIDIDGILESANIEEFIQDSQYSPFPTVFNTERPDVVAAGILEGRIAILVDGTPFALIIPALFVQFFQASEDYYQRSIMASLIRLLRFVSFGITLLAPAFYIAVITFHPELIPPSLLVSLAAQREGVPFPAFVEAVIMEITFEILREAGLRMPRVIGSAMSIVGAFVIGTAAVEAGIISAAMVIVVSITAISSFVSPTYDIAIAGRILRFLFMIFAASFGLFGIIVVLIALVLHLCSLRSFGVPYMSPLAPFSIKGQKDTFIRLPIWRFLTRPDLISKNRTRQQYSAPSKKNK